MAKVIRSATKRQQSATTHKVELPPNSEDDLILVCVAQDGNLSSVTLTIDQSFTIQQQNANGTDGKIMVAYKVAGSGGQTTAPTVTSSVSAEWTSTTVIVRGADTSDIFEAFSSATTDTVDRYNPPTVTTSENNCLVFTFVGNFGTNRDIAPAPLNAANLHRLSSIQADNFGGSSHSLDWSFLASAGTSATQEYYALNTVSYIGVTFAINDSGDGYIPGYIDPGTQPSKLIDPLRGNYYPVGGGSAPSIASYITTIDGFTTVLGSPSPGFFEGYNLYHNLLYIVINSTGMGVFNYRPASTVDFTWGTGLFSVQFMSRIPADAPSVNSFADGGFGVLLYDNQATEEYIYWKVGSSDASRSSAEWIPCLIQVDDAQGTAQETYLTPDLTNITGIGFTQANSLLNNSFCAAFYTLYNKVVVAGGGSAVPMDYQDLWRILSHVTAPYAERLGTNSFLAYIPIVIGGGQAVHTNLDGMSLQFPKSFDPNTKDFNVHVADNKLGLTLDGNSGDTISITNSLLSGASKWHFIMASGLAGTYNLSGTTISNAGTVTLRDISQDLSGLTFSECDTIALNDCALTNSTITASTADVALDIDDPTECADLSNLSFVDNTNGHSIELKATGTYTFDNFTFSGGGADSTTTADVYNNTGGAITINISGGGDTPTVRNGAGASTTVQNSVTVTVTVIDEDGDPIQNARVLLEESPGGTDVLTGLTDASGVATTSYAFTSTQAVTGWVRKGSGSPYYKQATLAGSITSSGYDVTVTMVADE